MENLIIINTEELKCMIKSAVEDAIYQINTKLNHSETSGLQLLTRSEAAKQLNVDLSTLYRWAKSEKLKTKKIGNRVYYLINDIKNSLN